MQYIKKNSIVVTQYWLNGQGNNTMSEWSSVRNLSETYILFSIVLIFFATESSWAQGPNTPPGPLGQHCCSSAAALPLHSGCQCCPASANILVQTRTRASTDR